MALGQVSITLRPIKFGMLVDYADPDALLQAIRVSLFLWGGIFNPIIPVFEKTPDNWSDSPLPAPTPAEILQGYLRFFDPDVLVTCGAIDPSSVASGGRSVISAADITAPITESGVPGYGIGLFEILAALGEKEFKFVRRDGLRVFAPTFDAAAQPFLATILGDVPPEGAGQYEDYLKLVETERPAITFDNYLDTAASRFLFRRQLCNYGLEVRRRRFDHGDAVFFLDHTDPLDVIDFWNLRAIGWNVLPIPRQLGGTDKAKTIARQFIAAHEERVPPPGVGNRVTILKARSIDKDAHEAFVNSLREEAGQVMTCQFWYPPVWDEFTHVRGHLRCSSLVADTRDVMIGDEAGTIRVPALAPEFLGKIYRDGCRYANDLRVAAYGLKDFGCEVIPRDEPSITRLFGFGLPHDWRIGANGLTFLGSHADETIMLEQPDAREVASAVLTARGYTAFKFSPAGNVAYQMVKHLGGPGAVGLLKSKILIEYLEDLSRGIDHHDLAQAFFGRMKRISEARPIAGDVQRLVQRYTDAKIFTLGVQVQCPACTQRSWFPVDALDYELNCPKCLATFKTPIHNPGELKWAYKNLGPFVSPPDDGKDEEKPASTPDAGLEWSYKSHGPFAAPKQGGGSYAVLLAVDFLRTHHHPSTTPILSFSATSKNGKELETDFMMFYRGSAFWETQTEWIFGECKTFNRFKQRDIDRMQVIADDFPDSVIVFATLNDEFSQEEKDILVPFVKACRAYGKLDRPRNPVLLLTGTELFSMMGPPTCWKEKGGKAATFAERGRSASSLIELCAITQSLYLDFGSWGAEWDEEFRRRREAAQSA
jgi:hypothetical protein